MSEGPIDFTVFDPPGVALARAIHERCAPQLLERRRSSTFAEIADWWRPMIAAVAVIALASTAFLAKSPRVASGPGPLAVYRPMPTAHGPIVQLAEALGIPDDIARSLTTRTLPTLARLVDGAGR